MSWNYDSSLGSAKDKVRFLVQDTDSDDQLASDEEILFTLDEAGDNIYRAASIVCSAVSLQFAKQITINDTRGLAFDPAMQADKYEALAKKWDQKALMSGGVGIFAGGISVSDKQTREEDTDRVQPGFTTELHRTPGIGSLDDDSSFDTSFPVA